MSDVAVIAISPEILSNVAPAAISAEFSFFNTTFRAIAPAIATSPVPDPDVAAAVIKLVLSVSLSEFNWLSMPELTVKSPAVMLVPVPMRARFVDVAIFKPTPPPIL